MIAIVAVISTSIVFHNYHFFLVVGVIKFQSLSKFDDYTTILLSVFTILYIRSPGLIYSLLQEGELLIRCFPFL